jgi:hypothetical protein
VFHRSPAARPAPATRGSVGVAPGREVFRLAPPVILWWVWLAFVAANIADLAIQGAHEPSARFVIVLAAVLATITGLAYALALRPRVIAEQADLAIINPFRDHRVPWAAIQTVDTGDWVRVHYAPGGDARGAQTSAVSRSITCWALYVSARTKRKAARPPRPRRSWFPALPGGLGQETDNRGGSRLPEEAKYLASLPPAKAIASRLDTRAEKERARGEHTGPATARWAWLPLAAVAVPALALLIVVLA